MLNRLNPTALGTPIAISICLAAATLAAYGRVCQCDFVNFDDKTYVTDNPHVLAGLTPNGIGWAFTTFHFSNWHPLTWLSFQADAQLFGIRAWGYHLTNLLLHVLNVFLLFWVFFRMTGRAWCCLSVAALFALHPLHVESVAWVSERKDVLSTFFWLLTMLAFCRYVAGPTRRAYAAVVASFALGLMAKPMLVTLPCVLLLLDFWPLGRWQPRKERGAAMLGRALSAFRGALAAPIGQSTRATWRRAKLTARRLGRRRGHSWGELVFEKLPLFALACASSVVTLHAQHAGGAVGGTNLVTYGERLTFMFVAYERYICKTAWPNDLCVFYPLELGPRIFWEGVIAAAIVVATCVSVVLQARSRPYLLVGWFWFLGTLLPVIGLVKVGTHLMADRYTYVPSIGLSIMAAWGLAEVAARGIWARWTVAAAAAAACAGCAAVTRLQVETWRDSVSLWERATALTIPNAMASHNLGHAYLNAGRPGDAVVPLEIALTYGKPVRFGLAQAHGEFGMELMDADDFAGAERHFAQALDYLHGSAPLQNLQGLALAKQGKLAEAIDAFAAATRVDPKFAEAWYNLGIAREAREQWSEACECFVKALALEPENASYRAGLAKANGKSSRKHE